MGCGGSRQTKNIWWYLVHLQEHGYTLFSKQFWTDRKYIFHDSIGVYWNRLVKCELYGHKRVQNVGCNNINDWYCFDCHQHIN
jgi:hypothetical protein